MVLEYVNVGPFRKHKKTNHVGVVSVRELGRGRGNLQHWSLGHATLKGKHKQELSQGINDISLIPGLGNQPDKSPPANKDKGNSLDCR